MDEEQQLCVASNGSCENVEFQDKDLATVNDNHGFGTHLEEGGLGKNLNNELGTDNAFKINKTNIPMISIEEDAEELLGLGVCAYNQSDFEKEVLAQVDEAFKQQREEEKRKTAEKEETAIRSLKQEIGHFENTLAVIDRDANSLSSECQKQVDNIKQKHKTKLVELQQLENELQHKNSEESNQMDDKGSSLQMIFDGNDSQEERLIRTGQMTPFGTVFLWGESCEGIRKVNKISDTEITEFEKFLMGEFECKMNIIQKISPKTTKSPVESCKFPQPQTEDETQSKGSVNSSYRYAGNLSPSQPSTSKQYMPLTVQRRKKAQKKLKLISKIARRTKAVKSKFLSLNVHYRSDSEMSDFENGDVCYDNEEEEDGCWQQDSDEEYIPDEEIDVLSSEDEPNTKKGKKRKEDEATVNDWITVKKNRLSLADGPDETTSKTCQKETKLKKVRDDGLQEQYLKRLRSHHYEKFAMKHKNVIDGEKEDDDTSFTMLGDGFKVPNCIWKKLYRYQQTGVRWLWELHQQNSGGIIGDEMGLGKTIQVISFLAGLSSSNIKTHGDKYYGLGPVILVCPTTVMHQWVKEFHKWWPPFRVAILHDSGSYRGTKESLVRNLNKSNGILITSYNGLAMHQTLLLKYEWHYIILDEGHRIRNPDAQATLACKQFRTPHRMILSGSPIQNSLKELWSLFDFIFPGKLGTLPVFMQQFSVPITQGGYSNASQVQVQTAYKCAVVLRDTIKPYLLRRMKDDVKANLQLPAKNEQVLFCKLTEEQKNVYKDYLNSPELANILRGSVQVFVGLIILRKICNHPDLYTGGPKIFKNTDVSTLTEEMTFGYPQRSGKMIVVDALLKLWRKQGHRVLLFSQSRQMLLILENFVKSRGYTYMTMNGSTPIATRQPAINKFNSDPNIFVFLLTTHVGGLGVNLTGADRVIIYDPDWNPSTDTQARERAWRIGQDKQVTIYRLLTSGTIEEKIYHRQIFKQFLTNRVLKDPRQRRFFKTNDLFELFTFSEKGKQGTETSAIFAGTGSEVKVPRSSKLSQCTNPPGKEVLVKKSDTEQNKPMKEESTEPPPSLHEESLMKSSSDKNALTNSFGNSAALTDFQVKPNPTDKQKEEKSTVLLSPEKLQSMKQLARKLSQLIGNSSSGNAKIKPDLAVTTKEIEQQPLIEMSNCGSKLHEETLHLQLDISASVDPNLCRNKRKKKKGKQKRKGVVVDGEKIDFVVKHDVYKPVPSEADNNQSNLKHDDYVLKKLFKSSGLQTVVQHDVIMNSSDPDYMLVEGEAEKVAQEALKALKKSQRQCLRAETGVPTWTGQHGASSSIRSRFGIKKSATQQLTLPKGERTIQDSKNKNMLTKSQNQLLGKASNIFGSVETSRSTPLSSSQLLARMKHRSMYVLNSQGDGEESSENEEKPSSPSTSKNNTEYDELLSDLRNFVAFQASVDGQATTQEVLQAFKEKCPTHSAPVFKMLLQKICNFYRRPTGEGVWRLKAEFR
ncbi:LOW QUALITY PROTEIN: DNA excision repair protein ERCC-6-like [Tachypleus tridentatus]|uniref:LOW QUALITY PROTEIN: DNA excision repair protein ERCC-6-like n=1 Tax=Tachypleus tridentatus TaxID=6853 RepID=UPI003FD166D2